MLDNLSDEDVVIRTLDGEAGNQGYQGMQGVGCVIQNRVILKWQCEVRPRSVCLHRLQFDCWLPGKDYQRITAPDYVAPDGAIIIADLVLKGILPDITNGATHYFDDSIAPPAWAYPAKFTVKIMRLNFYNLS